MIIKKQGLLLFTQSSVLVLHKNVHQLSSSTTMRHTTALHDSIQLLGLLNYGRVTLARSSHLRNQLCPHGSAVLIDTALLKLHVNIVLIDGNELK